MLIRPLIAYYPFQGTFHPFNHYSIVHSSYGQGDILDSQEIIMNKRGREMTCRGETRWKKGGVLDGEEKKIIKINK